MKAVSSSPTASQIEAGNTTSDSKEKQSHVVQEKQDGDPNLVNWDENDPENPQNWSQPRKIMLLITVSTCAFCVTCTSSIISNAYQGIQDEFHISKEVAILGVSLFVVGTGHRAMLLGPLSEFYGRRPVYLVSYTLLPC